jgi:sensor histidine kinase YesM
MGTLALGAIEKGDQVLSMIFWLEWPYGSTVFYGLNALLTVMLGMNFQVVIFRDWFKGLKIEERLLNTEEKLLQIHLNPHFFKNMLNNIYNQVYFQKPGAAESVIRLQHVMEYMLYETDHKRIPLKDEVNFIKKILDIEKLRLPVNYSLKWTETGDAEGKYVIPLCLLPFIENAFQHGDLSGTGSLEIKIKIEDNMLTYKVVNKKVVKTSDTKGGIGLSTLKNRLDLAYTGFFTYSLDFRDKADQYEAELILFDLNPPDHVSKN